jgi:hypothetical protein
LQFEAVPAPMTTPLLPTHVIEALDELMFAALCGVPPTSE